MWVTITPSSVLFCQTAQIMLKKTQPFVTAFVLIMKNKNIQSEEKALFYPSLCQRDSINTKLGGTPENGGGAEMPPSIVWGRIGKRRMKNILQSRGFFLLILVIIIAVFALLVYRVFIVGSAAANRLQQASITPGAKIGRASCRERV